MSEFKPKAWMTCPLCNKPSPFPDPNYREWVGLTDEEIESVYMNTMNFQQNAKALETKLKEKNT